MDTDIPNMDFKKFSKYFILDDEARDQLSAADKSPCHEYMEKVSGDSSSLLSNDSGILLTANKGKVYSITLNLLNFLNGIIHLP